MSIDANNTSHFGFYGRLTRDFPSQVVVDLTERCNLACIHCPHAQFKKSPYYGGRFLPSELNTKLVDEVRGRNGRDVQYIRYTSEGEPLLHPDCYQMIEYAVKHSGVYVTLTTQRHHHERGSDSIFAGFGHSHGRHQHRRLDLRDLRPDSPRRQPGGDPE